jgi:peptide/nickel transport system substrate-binding protein
MTTTPASAFSALAFALALGVAGSPALAQQGGGGGTLRIGLQEDPDVLDPHRARTFVGRIVFMGLCDKLLDITPQLEIVPQLATEWTVAPDGLSITMRLRQGVRFHDGEPFNAEAAKANLERARTLPDSLRRSEIASIASVDVVDPMTIRLNLSRPDATLLSQLTDRAGMMLSPRTLAGDVGARPVCSGPYRFVERVQNDRIVLERFPEHWRAGEFHFDRVIYRAIPDTTVRLANLRAGDLDMLERLAPTDVAAARRDQALRVVDTVGLGYQGITVNTAHGEAANNPLGRDRRVRLALSLSLDRAVINQVVFENTQPPANQSFPPASFAHMQEFAPPARNVARARQLLREAGHERVRFTLQVANNPVQQQLAQVMQAMAAEAGIEIEIRSTEFATLLREQQQGRFQASLVGWSGRIDPDGNIHPFVTTGGGQNDGRYSNPEVDRLLNEARTRYSPDERRPLYLAAQRILAEDLPIIYNYYQPWYFAMSSRLEGFVVNPDGMIRLNGMRIRR